MRVLVRCCGLALLMAWVALVSWTPAHADDEDASPEARAAEGEQASTPDGFVTMTVAAVVPQGGGGAVLLINEDGDRLVPIHVGHAEALAISLRLEDETFPRPLTHDLLDQLLMLLDGQVEQAQVVALRDGVFIAGLRLKRDDQELHVDARASDAIAVALGNDAPIFVASDVLEEAGMSPDDEPPSPEEQQRRQIEGMEL